MKNAMCYSIVTTNFHIREKPQAKLLNFFFYSNSKNVITLYLCTEAVKQFSENFSREIQI